MYRLSLILLTTTSISASMAQEAPKTGPQLESVWAISEGLKAPESAYVDPGTGFLFLSQIGEGGGKGKDGDGWISKLTTDGQVIKNKWVTGLNAPKGVRSHKGTLYVSDIDRIVAIDIAAARITKIIDVRNAVFLNDLATDSEGTVYVSDLAASKIYQYKNGEVTVFAAGEQLEHPNGVLVDGDSLVIGGWGTGFSQEDFSTKVLGRLQKINLRTKEMTAITPEPVGHLDGIEADGKGGYIVTDWRNGKLFRINKKGKARLLMNFPQGVADHAYLVDKQLIILPEMMEGKLTAFRYAPGRKKPTSN
jgi:hypothetical protein